MSIQCIKGVFLADTARVHGDVELGRDVNVWYGAAIRGDVAAVRIGPGTNVQDNAVVHCDYDIDNEIGANVTIGHGAVVHGAFVGAGSLIGMQATLLSNTRIGQRCLIAAGAVVAPGMQVPDDTVVMGLPGRIVRPTTDEEKENLRQAAQRYVELAMRYSDHSDDPRVRPFG